MAITSASTAADIEAAYLDNADYDATNSPAKCRLFIAACRALLLRRPSEANVGAHGGHKLAFDMRLIQAELTAARQWLSFAPAATADRGGGITHPSFLELRDYGGPAQTGGQGRDYGTD